MKNIRLTARLTGILALLTLIPLSLDAAEYYAPSSSYATVTEAATAAAASGTILVTADHTLSAVAAIGTKRLTIASDTPGVWRTITAAENAQTLSLTGSYSVTLQNIILQGTGSTTTADGRAVNFAHSTVAASSTIAGNFTMQGFNARGGGAINIDGLAGSIVNLGSEGGMMTFKNNRANSTTGGAVRIRNNDNALVLRGTSFFQDNSSATTGGAIFAYGNFTAEGAATFTGNVAETDGGALYNNGTGTTSFKSSAVFEGNRAGREGGVMYVRGDTIFDDNATFTSNTAATAGGAIYFNATTSTLAFNGGATFTGNQSLDGSGGAVRSNGAVISNGNLVLTNNKAAAIGTTTAQGGAIYTTSTFLSDGSINATGNSAAGSGGAIYSGALARLDGTSIFASNTAGTNGGAMDVRGSFYISGQASFTNNVATSGKGGALYIMSTAVRTVSLTANTGDITFQGNTASGAANAIFFDQTAGLFTLNLTPGEGRSIDFYDPIESNADDASVLKMAVNKTGAGTVLFDTHTSDISADTLVSAGTFALGGQATYGGDSPNTTFTLGAAGVLAGSGTIRAGAIALETGATLRAAASQTLSLRSAAGNQYSNRVHLAGAGTIDAGPGGTLTAGLVTIGESALAAPETLTITGNLNLTNATLNYGLHAAGIDLLLIGGTLTLSGTNTFNFSEFMNGTYTLIDAGASIINNSSTFKTTVNGSDLVGRSSATYTVNNDLLEITLSKQNAARAWNAAINTTWNDTAANWTEGDQLFADGDSVIFSPAATTTITVAASGVTAADMTVATAADTTFTGGRIKTDAASWQGAPPPTATTGKLIKDGAGTLTLANDTANEFTGGVTINQGIISIANAGQLGAPLGKIEFAATTAAANARIAITGAARFDTAPAGAAQTLAIDSGKHGGFIVRANASLAIASATGAINIADNGAFYLDVETGGTAAFTGNIAAAGKGGFMHLGSNATANLDIAAGATLTIGQTGNATTDTITSAATTATITKNGSGALLIHSNNSTYTGATHIAAGSLILDGPSAKLGGAVTIAGGAQLSGNGALTGSLTLNTGATLQVGDLGATGTISTGALFLNGATLDYDLGDLITASTLALTGTNTFRFSNFDTVGAHQLIIAGSITGFDAASIKTYLQKGASYVEVGAPGSRYTITYQNNAAGLLMNLAIANTALTWSGATGNQWGMDGNWLGSDTAFATGDSVTFNSAADTGNETNRAIEIVPAGVIVADMAVAGGGTYTFTGGAITGVTSGTLTSIANATGKLEKTGPGLLILDNDENTFAGGIAIRAGTLQSNPASLGSNTITLDAAGTLVLDLADSGTYTGAVSGLGTVTKQGSGTLALAAGKTISSATFIQNEGHIDMAAGTITAANYELRAGTLMLRGGTVNATTAFTLDTHGTLLGTGTLAAAAFVHKGTLQIGKASGLTDTHATLTIKGDYAGAGGTIALNTVLNEGGASTQSDQLLITGNATGNASLSITNDGGRGDDTINGGIKVVGIGGTNDIDLTLANRVVEDVYDYALIKNSDGFYLAATAPSPEIPAAASLTAAAMFMGNASLDALMTRLAEIRSAPGRANNLWLAASYHSDETGASFWEFMKVKTAVLQAGYDFALSRPGAPARWNLGLYFTHLQGDTSHESGVTIENKASGGGLYLLHTCRAFRLDLALKAGNNNYSVNTPAGAGRPFDHLTSKGWNLAGTIEAGYAVSLGKMGFLEPQAQLTWQRFETGPANDVYKRNYVWDNADSLRMRAGIRWSLVQDPHKKKALLPWVRMSEIYEKRGDYSIHVTGHRDKVYTYKNDIGGTGCRVDGGLVWIQDDSLHLGLSAAWRAGKAGDGFTVQASANITW